MKFSLALVLTAVCVATVDAGPFRTRRAVTTTTVCASSTTTTGNCAGGQCVVPTTTTSTFTATTVTTGAVSALDEVNAKRARAGLRPFIHDPALTVAAERCAAFRAQHRLFGHTPNDFSFLGGASANAAGCAAYPESYGWLSCCTYDGYTYAGAAFVVGSDGKRYMHLFVR